MAATPSPSIKPPNLAPTLGALYLGVVGAAILYGTTNVQIYFYVRKYREDRTWLKCAVAFLWLLDTLHMVFIVIDIWHGLIESFGNYEALLPIKWSYKAQESFSVLIILLVETLYARRIWQLSSQKARFWRYIIVVAGICGYSACIILLVKSFQLHSFLQSSHVRWEVIFTIAMSTICDVVFAAGVCHLFSLSMPTLGTHGRTKAMMWLIMRYVLISGALTSLCSLAALICFCTMFNNFVALAILFVTTKLYVNSYLAMLNARKSIRERGSISHKTMEMSSLEIGVSSSQGTNNIGVPAVETTTRDHGQGSSGVEESKSREMPIAPGKSLTGG